MRTIASLENAVIGARLIVSSSDIEDNKLRLQDTLQFLFRFRQAIESGYMLLAGSSITPRRVGEPLAQVAEILKNPRIVSELDETVRFGLDRRTNDQGQEWNLYDANLDSGGLMGWHGTQISGRTTTPIIRVGETLPQTTGDELNKLVPQDIWEEIRRRYPEEVQQTLNAVGVATSLNSAVLFDRQVHSSILSAARDPSADLRKQITSVASFNLALPYLEGVPADRLLDLREFMPEAFLEFRSRIVDIVNRAQKENPENATEYAKLLADRELLPHIRKLKSELESASRKAKLIGYGLPVISTVGALAGSFYGIDVAAIIAMLMAGPAGSIKAAADLAKERKAAEGNPMYFHWKARQV